MVAGSIRTARIIAGSGGKQCHCEDRYRGQCKHIHVRRFDLKKQGFDESDRYESQE